MTKDLFSAIAGVLPQSDKFNILYIQSNPVYIKSPINIPKSSNVKPDTIKVRHFLTVTSSSDIILLGIEIFVYLQIYPDYVDQYIFVSKCDTVGFTKVEFKLGPIIEQFIKYLINYNLNDYKIKPRNQNSKEEKENIESNDEDNNSHQSETLHLLNKLIGKLSTNSKYYSSISYYNTDPNRATTKPTSLRELPPKQNIKVSLFTKASPQYLFPDSAKNIHKHVINGQQLLKWWIPIIDRCTLEWPIHKLIIPGSDKISLSKFIEAFPNWSLGHIFKPTGRAVYSIALFPDDPKGRFLEHLIVENRYANVNVDQFYEELGYRQEFRLGDLVGLIGCEIFDVPISSDHEVNDLDYLVPKLSVHQYKQFLGLMKLENYSIETDIKSLANTKIPTFFELNNIPFQYKQLVGQMTRSIQRTTKQPLPKVNTLNVKRKTNDLTGLIKRKKAP